MEGIITSSFGERVNPLLDSEEFHNGIDIAVPEGTDVVAVKSGIISEKRTSSTYGNLVKYETFDSYTIMYAHLSEVNVEVGQEVIQGEIIAKSGNTGLTTGAHLHYSIWEKEECIDPMPFVSLKVSSNVVAEYEYRGETINWKN